MADYIERETICEDCVHYDICIFHPKGNEKKECVRFKNKADVVEVRHGEWEDCECSVCGKVNPTVHLDMLNEYKIRKTPYCPNCGAKMDGKGGRI